MIELLFVFGLLSVLAVIAALLWRRRSREPETHHEQTYQHGADRDRGAG
jgi:type II secretory pathway pseudopilin PulG